MTFEIYHELSKCKDSMLFDSHESIATYGTDDNYISLDVYGEVNVYYKDELYYRASEMPDELLEHFRNGTADCNEEIYIQNNNWFAYVHVVNNITDYNDFLCESAISKMTELELLAEMQEVWDYFNNG